MMRQKFFLEELEWVQQTDLSGQPLEDDETETPYK
jgi:hypothetical protein